MKKNYAVVPHWWFLIILAVVGALALYTCEGFHKQMQLPYWGLFLAAAIALFFTLPIGVIQATTNQVALLSNLSDGVKNINYNPTFNMLESYIKGKGIVFSCSWIPKNSNTIHSNKWLR